MLFFGKKNKITEPEINVPVETIPLEFLGGANPVVQYKDVPKTVERAVAPVLSVPEKRALDATTTVGAGGKRHLANLLTSRKFIFVGLGVLLVVFAAGASAYYLIPYFSKPPVVAVVPAPVVTAPEPLPVVVEPLPVVVAPMPEPEPAPVLTEVAMEFPSVLLADSADYDNDDITDAAEELFLTDVGVSDSDNDKYPDGHEIYHLYNPSGKAPVRIIDSGLVTEYANPVFGYKLYYPKNWAVASIDSNHRDVLFSTLTGENIEVRVFDLASGQTLSDWMAVNAPSERLDNLTDFTTAFKLNGKQRSDYLVYYFADGPRLYVLVYHTTDSNTVNYRIVAKMMARSFQLGTVKEDVLMTLPVEDEVTAGLTEPSVAPAPLGSDEVLPPEESSL
ncbi:MAG: hypothetical protein A3J93_01415 [Candidatus Magasanikbacteria bacterium RIFOXYC2_FULL_42_28]|uniref:Uncharacterized protein n=1 Tax=Candidatus Magasanikbacteria bacterium RIFOXYC2_FULL_42_28 TaxID=1798704 RepID=A0A1F6NXS5_9BACT|nr:MAG: hypothetical protein A3J93_01415 [Candidatus Magasanikbacteria bacterium RIFOXYC2_FULL_42_28]